MEKLQILSLTGEESEIQRRHFAYVLVHSISYVSISYRIMKLRKKKGTHLKSLQIHPKEKSLLGHFIGSTQEKGLSSILSQD